MAGRSTRPIEHRTDTTRVVAAHAGRTPDTSRRIPPILRRSWTVHPAGAGYERRSRGNKTILSVFCVLCRLGARLRWHRRCPAARSTRGRWSAKRSIGGRFPTGACSGRAELAHRHADPGCRNRHSPHARMIWSSFEATAGGLSSGCGIGTATGSGRSGQDATTLASRERSSCLSTDPGRSPGPPASVWSAGGAGCGGWGRPFAPARPPAA